MTRKFLRLAAPVMAGLVFVGCEKSESPATPPAPSAAAAKPTTDAGTIPAANATAEAQKLYDQVMQNIKDNKMQLAEDGLKKLEGMKASLPPEWAARIDQARKAFDTAKAAGMLPGAIR